MYSYTVRMANTVDQVTVSGTAAEDGTVTANQQVNLPHSGLRTPRDFVRRDRMAMDTGAGSGGTYPVSAQNIRDSRNIHKTYTL